jgi:hypothetical protein
VFVFGRSFWAVSLFGANVFVDQVQPALEGAEDEDDCRAEGEAAAAAAEAAAAGGRSRTAAGAAAGLDSAAGSAAGPGPPLSELLTGKFVLYVSEDADSNPRLALRVELARDTEAGGDAGGRLAARVARAVLRRLRRVSSEYANYTPSDVQLPLVTLHAFGDPQHFPIGVKHKYTLT